MNEARKSSCGSQQAKRQWWQENQQEYKRMQTAARTNHELLELRGVGLGHGGDAAPADRKRAEHEEEEEEGEDEKKQIVLARWRLVLWTRHQGGL